MLGISRVGSLWRKISLRRQLNYFRPCFNQGIWFFIRNGFNNLWWQLISVETHGELSFESAQAYYEYGNALLTKEEENPSNQILNNVEPENEDDGDEDEENEEEGAKQDDADSVKKYVEDDPEGDFQIAWESLDVFNIFQL